jgi:hypothetical protein
MTTATLTDTRRITEHDPAFLTLHAQTVAELRHSIDAYAQELQHATTLPSPHAFLTRHTAILTQAYVTGHAEGATAYPAHQGAAPDPSRMHRTLSFYVPSVAKMAAEGLRAWQAEHGQVQTFADPLDDGDIYAPFIEEWAQGEPLGARLILQGDVVWPAMQNGYLEAGATLRTKLYWDLDPLAKRHCIDCPGIAAASPYDPPGSGGNELNQTPGDGQTECGAGCRCALRYEGEPSQFREAVETWIFYRPDQLRVKGRFAFEGGRRREQGHTTSIRQPGHHGMGASGGGAASIYKTTAQLWPNGIMPESMFEQLRQTKAFQDLVTKTTPHETGTYSGPKRHEGDQFLAAYVQETGGAGLPDVVGETQLTEHIARGEWELWRGETQAAHFEQMKSGTFHVGLGYTGNGMYSGRGVAGKMIANTYAMPTKARPTPGIVARMSIKAGAHIVNYDDLTRQHIFERRNTLKYYADKGIPRPEQMALVAIFGDLGRYTAIKGYDGYLHRAEVLLVNRTVLRIQENAAPPEMPGK